MTRQEVRTVFNQGYACAVANIQRAHGEEMIAADVLALNPGAISDADEYDREILEKLPKRGVTP